MVEHRMCARHIYAAWSKKWKGEERKIAFWECAKSTYVQQLKEKLEEVNSLSDGIAEDMLEYPVEAWTKAYFQTKPKCDVVDNKESSNSDAFAMQDIPSDDKLEI